MRSQRRSCRRRGYTLIEVLVVVTVMGIAGAMVIPALGQTHVLRVQAAVRTVVADITFAQSDALTYQSPRGIVFDVASNRYTLVEAVNNPPDPETDALLTPQGPYVVDLGSGRFGGARIENVQFNGGATLIFDELGGPVPASGSTLLSDGGSIEIVGPDSRFRIDVAAFTGRVTVTQLE